jgi:hypothetical protein
MATTYAGHYLRPWDLECFPFAAAISILQDTKAAALEYVKFVFFMPQQRACVTHLVSYYYDIVRLHMDIVDM